jgi:hypothetical protein
MLSYFLSQEDKIIKKLSLFIMIMLMVTSIGFIYINNKSNDLNNLKIIYPYVSDINKTIYTDPRTKIALEYKSGYTLTNIRQFNYCANAYLNCKDNESFILKTNQIKNAYVLVNNKLINSISSAHSATNFPEWVNNPPESWITIKKIDEGRDSTILYYAP